MIILKYYFLQRKDHSNSFYVRSRESIACPFCGGRFRVIGSRPRILFRQDGSVSRLIIRRLQCRECGRISHELPDLAIPFKRYEANVISDALDSRGRAEVNCCPCENSTIRRWRLWYVLLHEYLEGAPQPFFRLSLSPMLGQLTGWLHILVRGMANSGNWQQTRFACRRPRGSGKLPVSAITHTTGKKRGTEDETKGVGGQDGGILGLHGGGRAEREHKAAVPARDRAICGLCGGGGDEQGAGDSVQAGAAEEIPGIECECKIGGP